MSKVDTEYLEWLVIKLNEKMVVQTQKLKDIKNRVDVLEAK